MQKWPLVLTGLPDVDKLEATLRWRVLRDGIETCELYGEAGGGPAAAFLRYAPGAVTPLHVHTGFEHVYVLRGSQRDHAGIHVQGSFVINPPGSRHRVESPDGCVVLIVWEKPVRFVEDGDA